MSIGSKSVPISPLVDIYSWSKSRPEWQRDALRRIVTQGSLKDADLDELEQICRHGRSALEKDEVPPIVIPLDAEHLPTTSAHGNGISLVSLSQVINVNRLPDDQTLSFQPGSSLTVIYGKNGAAKIRLCTHYQKSMPMPWSGPTTSARRPHYSQGCEGKCPLGYPRRQRTPPA